MEEVKELIYDALAMAALTHHWHLTVTGSGSYAAHAVLGDIYQYCHEIADTLGEQIQGAGEELPSARKAISIPFQAFEIKAACRTLDAFAKNFEEVDGPPWLANVAQEIQGTLYGHLFKLKRLS